MLANIDKHQVTPTIYLILLCIFISLPTLADDVLFNDEYLYYWQDSSQVNIGVGRIKDAHQLWVNGQPWPVSSIGQFVLPTELLSQFQLLFFDQHQQAHTYQIQKNVITAITTKAKLESLNEGQTPLANVLPVLTNQKKLAAWGIDYALRVNSVPISNCAPSAKSHTILLLHGLGRTSASMKSMANYLKANTAANVCRIDYPSKDLPIEMLSAWLLNQVEQAENHVSIVTHSMGGILWRYLLAAEPELQSKFHRAVLLAPPNHGSQIIDYFGQQGWFRALQGPAALQLQSMAQGVPALIPANKVATLVISGTKSSDPWFNFLFTSAHDGKVSIESAKLEGQLFQSVPYGHTWVMAKKKVQQQVLEFIYH